MSEIVAYRYRYKDALTWVHSTTEPARHPNLIVEPLCVAGDEAAEIARLRAIKEAADEYVGSVNGGPEKDAWDTETGAYEEGAESFASDWAWKAYDEKKQKAFDTLLALVGGRS